MSKATLEMAVTFARQCEAIAPTYGFHTALTGGCLYKDGERKDIDILFYRRSDRNGDKIGLLQALIRGVGVTVGKDTGFVVKAALSGGTHVDFLFPDFRDGGAYPS